MTLDDPLENMHMKTTREQAQMQLQILLEKNSQMQAQVLLGVKFSWYSLSPNYYRADKHAIISLTATCMHNHEAQWFPQANRLQNLHEAQKAQIKTIQKPHAPLKVGTNWYMVGRKPNQIT